MEHCPYCRVRAHPSVLRDHIDLAHAVSKTGRNPAALKIEQYPPGRNASPVRNLLFVECPVCHSGMQPHQLNKHLWWVHRQRPSKSSGHLPAKGRSSPSINVDDNQKSISHTARNQSMGVGSPTVRLEDNLARTNTSSDDERVTCSVCGSRIRLADLPLHKRSHTKNGVNKTTSALGHPMKRRSSSKRKPFYRKLHGGLPSLGKKR
jgi:hypothetical protein